MPLLIALAAALMLGLLGMHVLGGHESAHGSSGAGGHADALAAPAAHAHLDGVAAPPRQPAGAPASDDAAHAEDAAEHAEVAAAPATCAGCADLPALTAACVLALLGGILLLVLPAGWRMPSPPVLPLTRVRADVVRPRAPSLHILCISRT
ncbi:hypothetical protein MHM582_3109 [Microbacterium sp. HM58-2]|nr:hypothetical protein MHM582_3109 [Microbacterium sp. HM58-2]